jgi:hypothetical protein
MRRKVSLDILMKHVAGDSLVYVAQWKVMEGSLDAIVWLDIGKQRMSTKGEQQKGISLSLWGYIP